MTTTTTPTPSTTTAGDGGVLLADALSVNAVSSGLTGAALALGAPWLDDRLGAHAAVLAVIGIGLLLFAAAIVVALHRPPQLRSAARWVVTADVVWVVAAAVVVGTGLLTPLGDLLLAGVSVLVAGFAAAQAAGLRRAGDAHSPGARPVEITATREVAAAVEQAWSLVADAAGYAEFAPGIAETATDGAVADGMRRTCVDDQGRTWAETCAVIEPGRGYRMDVDADTYPLRYRLLLHEFAMIWHVAPTADGARLDLAFRGSVKLGVLGRLVFAAAGFQRVADRIVASYAALLDPDV